MAKGEEMARDRKTAELIKKLKRQKTALSNKVRTRDKRIGGLVRAFGLLETAMIKELKRDLVEANETITRLTSKKQRGK